MTALSAAFWACENTLLLRSPATLVPIVPYSGWTTWGVYLRRRAGYLSPALLGSVFYDAGGPLAQRHSSGGVIDYASYGSCHGPIPELAVSDPEGSQKKRA